MTPYPATFYTVHAVFPTLDGKPWGGLTDGPADYRDALAAVYDHFNGARFDLSRDTLRVWEMPGGIEVTAEFIEAIHEAKAMAAE